MAITCRRTRSPRRSRFTCALVGVVWVAWAGSLGCTETKYVVQAGMGQLQLWAEARPMDEVLNSSSLSPATRDALEGVGNVLAFAEAHALRTKGNYSRYVSLQREAVVWFMAAAPELSLEPKTWSFPIAGEFPYLGWFKLTDAINYRAKLEARGYDVYLRPVHAYSTGGWFRDPLLSTMVMRGRLLLTGTILHELVHANVFIPDQAVFNESLATFAGEALTEKYLREQIGEESEDMKVFRQWVDYGRVAAKRFHRAFVELETLYASKSSDTHKRRKKAAITEALAKDLSLRRVPNNARLAGFKTYNSDHASFRELLAACDGDWRLFWKAVHTIEGDDFTESQQQEFDGIVAKAVKVCAH